MRTLPIKNPSMPKTKRTRTSSGSLSAASASVPAAPAPSLLTSGHCFDSDSDMDDIPQKPSASSSSHQIGYGFVDLAAKYGDAEMSSDESGIMISSSGDAKSEHSSQSSNQENADPDVDATEVVAAAASNTPQAISSDSESSVKSTKLGFTRPGEQKSKAILGAALRKVSSAEDKARLKAAAKAARAQKKFQNMRRPAAAKLNKGPSTIGGVGEPATQQDERAAAAAAQSDFSAMDEGAAMQAEDIASSCPPAEDVPSQAAAPSKGQQTKTATASASPSDRDAQAKMKAKAPATKTSKKKANVAKYYFCGTNNWFQCRMPFQVEGCKKNVAVSVRKFSTMELAEKEAFRVCNDFNKKYVGGFASQEFEARYRHLYDAA